MYFANSVGARRFTDSLHVFRRIFRETDFSLNLYQAFTAIVPNLLSFESFLPMLKIIAANLNELADTKQH